MNSALIIEVVALLLGFYYLGKKRQDKARKNYVIIIMSLLIIESGLRAISVGPDTWNYYYWFEQCKYLSWNDVLNNTSEDRDPGFGFVMKLCQLISNDFNVFLTIAALWFFIPLGIILYRYSSNILQLMFAFTLYLSLFHIIALSGVRQQIAMGFSFFAFLLYEKDKRIYATALLLLGSMIHVSLLLFFAIPVMHYFVNRSWYRTIHFVTIVLIPAVYVGASAMVAYMASFLENDYYMEYAFGKGSGAFMYIVLMELLSIFCFLAIKKEYIIKNNTLSILYINLPLLTVLVPLIKLDGALIRMGQYFTMYLMILFPYAVDFMASKKARWAVYLIPMFVLFLSILRNKIDYEFCF